MSRETTDPHYHSTRLEPTSIIGKALRSSTESKGPIKSHNSMTTIPIQFPKGKDLRIKRGRISKAIKFWSNVYHFHDQFSQEEVRMIHHLTKLGVHHNGVIIGIIVARLNRSSHS